MPRIDKTVDNLWERYAPQVRETMDEELKRLKENYEKNKNDDSNSRDDSD